MKKLLFLLLLATPVSSFGNTDLESIRTIETRASHYRMLAIQCVTDLKLSKQQTNEIASCRQLNSFVQKNYQPLKHDLEAAQNDAKRQGNNEGPDSSSLRDKLVAIMSARSHMQIAGNLTRTINKLDQ